MLLFEARINRIGKLATCVRTHPKPIDLLKNPAGFLKSHAKYFVFSVLSGSYSKVEVIEQLYYKFILFP